MVTRSGSYVRERLAGGEELRSRSLSIASVHRQAGDAVVGGEGVLRRERVEVEPRSRREFQQRAREDAVDILGRAGLDPTSDGRFYRIDDEDSHFVTFAEDVQVPPGHVGLVRPRDSLRQAGALMETSFVAPGDDEVVAHLFVDERFVLVAEGATVAELVVVETA